MSSSGHHPEKPDPPQRTFSATKRFGGDSSSHGGRNPFNAISPITGPGLASPTTGSSAFGLGSGAFASFGSAGKTPKTPGTAFDFKTAAMGSGAPPTPGDKRDKVADKLGNSIRKE